MEVIEMTGWEPRGNGYSHPPVGGLIPLTCDPVEWGSYRGSLAYQPELGCPPGLPAEALAKEF